jgi:predicted RNA-binding protein (virulence factor B family)
MTPYELRFKIFEQAQTLADQEYHTRFAYVDRKKELDPTFNEDYPQYPTYGYIENLANKINNFVSCK